LEKIGKMGGEVKDGPATAPKAAGGAHEAN
jgi:hypothetical protein